MTELISLDIQGDFLVYLEGTALILMFTTASLAGLAFSPIKIWKPSTKLLIKFIGSTIFAFVALSWAVYEHTQLVRKEIRSVLKSSEIAIINNSVINISRDLSEDIKELAMKATLDTSISNRSAARDIRLRLLVKNENEKSFVITASYQTKSKWSFYASKTISPYFKGRYFIGNANDEDRSLYKAYCIINACDNSRFSRSFNN